MLSATLKAFLPGLTFGSYTLSIAIAYCENGKWISQGWSHLRVAPGSQNRRLCHYSDKVVLLNQPLRQREYYFYIGADNNLSGGFSGPFQAISYSLEHKYGIGLYHPCFWLEDRNFKKYDARYYRNGLDRFCDNVFSGKKWVYGWYYVDVGNASDYTISFELNRHSHTHYHYPHPH
jgi:hypothetical protein